MLAAFESLATLITIANWKDRPMDDELYLLYFGAGYPQTFFWFGNPMRKGSFGTFLLTDLQNRTNIWVPNKWTQMCLSYQKRDAFLRVTLVGLHASLTDNPNNGILWQLTKSYLGWSFNHMW